MMLSARTRRLCCGRATARRTLCCFECGSAGSPTGFTCRLGSIGAIGRYRVERAKAFPCDALWIGYPILIRYDIAAVRGLLGRNRGVHLLQVGVNGLELHLVVRLQS